MGPFNINDEVKVISNNDFKGLVGEVKGYGVEEERLVFLVDLGKPTLNYFFPEELKLLNSEKK